MSSCGSVTENISEFVDYCLQGQVKELTSYIRDSTDFIQKIKAIKCSAETLLVSLDIVSLYTNIPHEEGIKAVEKAAMVMGNKSLVRPKVLAKLTEIVLCNNTLQFAGENYLQIQGTAMGTKMAPAYANIFMGELEREWLAHDKGNMIQSWYRFIDDIFVLWKGSEQDLEEFVHTCNYARQTIKVTCVKSMESISFLDVTVYKGPNFIRNGTLDYRTHIKVTSIRSYVYSNSYHARGTRKGIIVGEIHRYHKTNSSNIHFWNQVRAHVQALVRRGYHMVEIKYHVRETLTKIARKQNDLTALTTDGVSTTRPPIGGVTPALVITYNDNMAHINGALRQIWGEVVNNDPLLHMLYPKLRDGILLPLPSIIINDGKTTSYEEHYAEGRLSRVKIHHNKATPYWS